MAASASVALLASLFLESAVAASVPVYAAPAVFSLSPRGSCGGNAICFEGSNEKDLELTRKLDKFACKDLLLRKGTCAQYGFPKSQGAEPFLPAVTRYNSPGNHLWFSLVNQLVPGGFADGGRCGEVDAAPYMPAALFKPENAKGLKKYIQVTQKAWGVYEGRCSDLTEKYYRDKYDDDGVSVNRNYTELSSEVLKAPWLVSGFNKLCSSACNCVAGGTWQPGSNVCRDTPQYCACQDVPDMPSRPSPGNFCSLCGPKYDPQASVTVYRRPQPPAPPPPPQCNPNAGCTVCAECCETYIGSGCNACVADKCSNKEHKTIVDLAGATPDLSTLVAALTAGGLIPTLLGAGPFTVFAPTNEAFAALPAGTVDSLLEPANKAQLVDVLTYHVVAGNVQAKDLKDGQMLKTVEGKSLTVRVVGTMVLVNSVKVITADVEASNGVVHIVDGVLLPPSN